MDGWVTIGTRLDNSKFDRQITQLEKKIEQLENKGLTMKTREQELQSTIQSYEELRDKVILASKEVERLKSLPKDVGPVKAGPYFERLNEAKATFSQLSSELASQTNEYTKARTELSGMNEQYTEINAKVEEYKAKLESVKVQKQQAEIGKVKESIKEVNKNLTNSVRSIGRMALGIFGIRSAFMMLRSASSQLAGYDKQYAANLEYIRFVLTQAIAPVLRWIVGLASQLLSIIGAIVNTLFGINIFSKASAKDFKNMKASAGGTAKAAKEISKELAGFDEMNVLNDNKSGGGGGTPDFDLSKMQGETPAWLKWIADNRELVLGFLAGLLTYLTLLQLGVNGIKALGIGLMVWGIVTAVMSLIEYLKDPSWENFGKIIQGIGIFIIGLGVAFLGLPAIITGVVVLILGTIIKYWDKIKAFLQGGIDWLVGKSDWVHTMFGDLIGNIYDNFVSNIQLILNWFDVMFTSVKGVFDGIIKFVKGVFTGDWKMAWEGIKQIFSNIWKAIKSTFSTVFEFIKREVVNVGRTVGNLLASVFKAVVNVVLGAIETILNSPINQVNGLIDLISSIPGVPSIPRIPTFNLPRLAKGTILNAPGRGTLVAGGTAIAGEAGREAYLPLSDTQLLEELGSTIGKYITINANIVNTMNGRVISRELKKVQNEQDFAYNN